MYFSLDGSSPQPRSSIYSAIVAPRPIGWISTVAADGAVNLAPFSYFNLLSSEPPIVMFSCTAATDRAEKDTLVNVRASGEFVYSMATVPLARQMVSTSLSAPYGSDEFLLAQLEKAPSRKVKPPRVALAPAAFECTVEQIIDIAPRLPGDTPSSIVIGRVVAVHVDDDLLDERGRFDTLRAKPLSRLGGANYAQITECFQVSP